MFLPFKIHQDKYESKQFMSIDLTKLEWLYTAAITFIRMS